MISRGTEPSAWQIPLTASVAMMAIRSGFFFFMRELLAIPWHFESRRCRRLLVFRQAQPGVHDRVRIQRHRLDALIHQPLGEVGMIGRALAADADVLALSARGLDR